MLCKHGDPSLDFSTLVKKLDMVARTPVISAQMGVGQRQKDPQGLTATSLAPGSAKLSEKIGQSDRAGHSILHWPLHTHVQMPYTVWPPVVSLFTVHSEQRCRCPQHPSSPQQPAFERQDLKNQSKCLPSKKSYPQLQETMFP